MPTEAEVLTELGYDAATHLVVGDVKVSKWETSPGVWQTSYRATVAERPEGGVNVNELVRRLRKHKPARPQPTGDLTFVVALADFQLGKSDGDGVAGTTARILAGIDGVEDRIRELRRVGRPLGRLLIAGMGDLTENCSGNYATQAFTVELNRREQLRLARNLLTTAISRWAKFFNEVVVTAVPGNHGENRNGDGKAYTTVGDNDDVAVFESIKEAFSQAPDQYGHVEFTLPDDEVEVYFPYGPGIAFTHGHIGRGSDPQKVQIDWWKGQAFGGHIAGQAKVLVTAHFHHFCMAERGGRQWLQCPSLDGGSDWYRRQTGEHSRPGTLTFVLGEKWVQDVQVI